MIIQYPIGKKCISLGCVESHETKHTFIEIIMGTLADYPNPSTLFQV
jgi:hypothetical protein